MCPKHRIACIANKPAPTGFAAPTAFVPCRDHCGGTHHQSHGPIVPWLIGNAHHRILHPLVYFPIRYALAVWRNEQNIRKQRQTCLFMRYQLGV